MKSITINIHEDESMSVGISGSIQFDDLISALMSTLLGAANGILKTAPEGMSIAEAKGTLYDMMNVAMSRTLEQFAPEFELHPNLTTQAILEAENQIIKEGRLSEVEAGT